MRLTKGGRTQEGRKICSHLNICMTPCLIGHRLSWRGTWKEGDEEQPHLLLAWGECGWDEGGLLGEELACFGGYFVLGWGVLSVGGQDEGRGLDCRAQGHGPYLCWMRMRWIPVTCSKLCLSGGSTSRDLISVVRRLGEGESTFTFNLKNEFWQQIPQFSSHHPCFKHQHPSLLSKISRTNFPTILKLEALILEWIVLWKPGSQN